MLFIIPLAGRRTILSIIDDVKLATPLECILTKQKLGLILSYLAITH